MPSPHCPAEEISSPGPAAAVDCQSTSQNDYRVVVVAEQEKELELQAVSAVSGGIINDRGYDPGPVRPLQKEHKLCNFISYKIYFSIETFIGRGHCESL